MQADIFRDILVPVIGGLGIFMLGLEFMSNGIQSLAVNKMRALLAKVAGTPITGLMAGTFITGVIQSSTAMTVMTVGLVNAGVMGLRPAISVIMGANIGTTLGNGLIALPLGPLGLFLGGIFALVYIFAKDDKVKNIALACMGFALIFYGLNLMTGGLRPLRGMPEVMSVISGLKADNFVSLIYCMLIAAFITAMIHSSSATIGIVMGLGAAGVLEWQTAVAFSLGADLGTTITSWMASWNLSKNAKRAAYAHITFNIIGVAVMLPLFFLSMRLLVWVMGWFGGDPGVAVVVDGKETFPLVPVAVGLYSTVFNIFNTALMFPFIGVFDRVLSRIGHSSAGDVEDYSQPRHLAPNPSERYCNRRPRRAAGDRSLSRRPPRKFMDVARGTAGAPDDVEEHYAAIDVLSRDIRLHGGDVQARHAAFQCRSAGEPDRGGGLDGKSGRDALPDRSAGQTPDVLGAWVGSGQRDARSGQQRYACDRAGVGRYRHPHTWGGPGRRHPGAARPLPAARCGNAVGGAWRYPHAVGQCRACPLSDRSHCRRAAVGVARRCAARASAGPAARRHARLAPAE